MVFASSATRFQVEPAARAMGVEHVLVTPVEIENGIATGRPGGPPLWRRGKAEAVQAFAPRHGVDLEASYAYSNGTEDVPFLSTVGRARALNPEPGLALVATEKGWPVVRFRPRGRAGLREIARTAAGAAGTVGGFGAGVALGALNGSRRDGVDLGIALAGELGTALAGVRLDVRGAEYLESARPAVFLFNHQSQLDVLILAKLLRGGFTGVAKKEAANVPAFGLMFRLADMAFVDRGNTTQAKAALAPAVARLREGISLVMAPEGTRSATPALGPFKKGAFHVAMQAGVPIVPIVIRNAGELMWRGASTIREGTVAGHRAAAGTDRRLDGRRARQARRRGARALPRDPRRVGRPARRGSGHDGAHRAGRRAARMGHRGRDEPARDGDVARRAGRPAAALERHAAGAARRHPGVGPAAGRARVGLADGAADAPAGGRARARASGRPRGSPSTASTSPSTCPART